MNHADTAGFFVKTVNDIIIKHMQYLLLRPRQAISTEKFHQTAHGQI